MTDPVETNSPENMLFKAGDLYNLPRETINAIQHQYDEYNVQTINNAFKNGEITEPEKDYLLSYYQDGMESYRKAYRAIYELLGQPENTCAYDPITGKIDVDETGKPINYGLKVLTPFVNTRLEYRDKNNNPIYVIFPKIKSAKRAIEKLKNEYGVERILAMKKSFDRYLRNEDKEGFREELQNIPETTSSLHDILRLTITGKYLTDVKRLSRKLAEQKEFHIVPSETRDRFDKPLSDNPKRYYDIKMTMHLDAPERETSQDVEVQLKINTLYHGDIQTHAVYEEVRQLEPNGSKRDNAHAQALKMRIAHINKTRIHLYNMMVIDKARRIEEDGYIPIQASPDFSDGTYRRCRDFIKNEYMPESLDDFNWKTAFSADNETNKLCFLHLAKKIPAEFDEFEPNASAIVEQKFAALGQAEKDRFNAINEVAARYSPQIQIAINKKKQQEAVPQKRRSVER